MACGLAARAEETEYDPAKVSDSLKAIFQFGSAQTKQALNANTITLITGTIGGTYVQIGADLASVLDDGNKLRVLPIVGRGSVQSVADILFLQGVDIGIVRADTLDYLERKGFAKDIKKQFTYVTKLYNEEMQVADAALLLAQTYDPDVLGTADVRNTTPEPAKARAWYQKAAQLGSADAQRRLAQLPN